MTKTDSLINHVSRTATIILNETPDKILPLFTAYGETLWITGWNPDYVYPENGEAVTNSVWKTRQDENTPETIWITADYDREKNSVTYFNVIPDKQVTRIDIQCDPFEDSRTSAQITYTITALGQKGAEYISQLTEKHYHKWMRNSWELSINYYLRHGKAVPHN